MTTNEKVRTIREWLTSVVTLLIIPVCWLVLDHQRLLIERYVMENYWTRSAHTEYADDHLKLQNTEIKRVEKQLENNASEARAINNKIDALIVHVTALQTKMDSMNTSMQNIPNSPFKR